jgi:hypothetical protein
MQIHNYGASETVFSMSQFGRNNSTPGFGIGNKPGDTYGSDWTFAGNAASYSVKNIYVLAHWGNPPEGSLSGTLPVIWTQPRPLTVLSGKAALFSVFAQGAASYQWRRNGVWIAGATRSWLEITSADYSDSGVYDVLAFGSGTAYATSQSATLTVTPYGTVLLLR